MQAYFHRFRKPGAVALLAGALGLTIAPAADALDLQREHVFTGGSLPGVIVPMSMWDTQLRGIVQVNWVLATAELSHRNHYFAYDTELYFSGLGDIGLPRDLAQPPVSGSLAPTQLRYALPGDRNFPRVGYRYDFRTGHATGGTFKGALARPVDTTDSGLFVYLMNWTGDPGTSMDITRTKLTFGLTITKYQLFANPNVDGIAVQRGDQAYNAEQFENRGSISFDDEKLTNRDKGEWTNSGSLAAVSAGQVFVNDGAFVNNRTGTVKSALINTGTVHNQGNWSVTSSAPLSLLDNRGRIVNSDGGRFTIDSGAKFSSVATLSAGDDARIIVDGTLLNLTDEADPRIELGDTAQLQVRGNLVNDGTIGALGKSRILVDGGGTLQNKGTASVAGGASLYVTGTWTNVELSSRLELTGTSSLTLFGRLENHGGFTLNDQAFVNQLGSFENWSRGMVINGGEFRNQGSGIFANHGGLRIQSGGLLRNTALLSVNDGSSLQVSGRLESSTAIDNVAGAGLLIDEGGSATAAITNRGQVAIVQGGELNSRTEYRQTSGQTLVGGVLYADAILIDGGFVSGSGTLRARVVRIGPGATVGRMPATVPQKLQRTAAQGAPERVSGPLLNVVGDLVFEGAVLELDFASAADFATPAITATGEITFEGGTLNLSFIDGYAPQVGERPVLFSAGLVRGLDSLKLNVTGLASGLALAQGSHGFEVVAASVPEPGALALWLLGLPVLAAWDRRRSQGRLSTRQQAC